MKKVRESNIELLRILTMCGVIVLHYNNATIGGGFQHVDQGSVNYGILLVLESLTVCAVDLFVLITGFFSSTSQKRDPVKVIGLILQVSIFRVGVRLLGAVLGNPISAGDILVALIPVNYFVILYAALYILSPYINMLLNRLSAGQRTKLLIIAMAVLSVWPTAVDAVQGIFGVELAGLSTIGMYGSQWGYTLINFILMYLVGAYLRLNHVEWKAPRAALVLAGCVAVITAWSLLDQGASWSYCNPLVILEAVALFLLFRNFHFHSKVVNALAKAAFTCFLLHSTLFPLYQIPQAVQLPAVMMVGHLLLTCVTIYLICWICSVVYGFVEIPILKLTGFLVQKIGLDFSLEEPEVLKAE